MKNIVFSFIFMLFLMTEILTSQVLAIKQATPQRPSFSTSTFTTYPGSLELESGVSLSDKYFETQFMVKYGAGLNFEAFVMFSPFLQDRDTKSDGLGDVRVGGRYRFWINFYEDKSLAIQLWGKLPSAPVNRSWASGEFDFQGALIYTSVYKKFTVDANLGITSYGRPHGYGEPLIEPFGTLCWTTNLTNKLSVITELYGYIEKEPVKNVLIGLAGFSYAVTPKIVADMGFSWGLRKAPYDWQILPGFTINF